jgi:hypothetical protein
MRRLTEEDNVLQAADYVLRGYENGGAVGLASAEQLDRIYARASVANSYEKMMKTRGGLAMASLDLYEKSTGEKEESTMDKIVEGTGKVFGAIADFVDPSTDKKEGEPTSPTPLSDKLGSDQAEARSQYFAKQFGAKTDASGTYIETSSHRVYLRQDSNSWKLDSGNVSFVTKTEAETGMISSKAPSKLEEQGVVMELNDNLFTYEGKGKTGDYMTDPRTGKPLYIDLGWFNDLPDTLDHDTKMRFYQAGIWYKVLFSKNGKRVIKILTQEIYLPFQVDGKYMRTTEVLYSVNGFKYPDGSQSNWNPWFTEIGIGLTPNATRTLNWLKIIVGGDYKNKKDLDKIFRDEFLIAGDIAGYEGLLKRSGMVDQNGDLSEAKKVANAVVEKVAMDKLTDSLGIKDIKDLESDWKANPESYTIPGEDGKIYSKRSGLWVGTIENGKFKANTEEEIGQWFRNNQDTAEIIRKNTLKELRQSEYRAKGELGLEGMADIVENVYKGSLNLAGDKNYEDWLNKNVTGRLIIQKWYGDHLFNLKLSADGTKVEYIKPVMVKENVGYHLVGRDGKPTKGVFSKEQDWIKFSDVIKNPEILDKYLFDIQSNSATKRRIDPEKLHNTRQQIGESQNQISDVLAGKYIDTNLMGENTQTEIRNYERRLRETYSSDKYMNLNENFQGLIKDAREKYLSGNYEKGAFREEDGVILTREGIPIGSLDSNGQFVNSTNKEVYEKINSYLDIHKPSLYKAWFGAEKDELGNWVINNGDTRVVLDMDRPVSMNWKDLVKDVQWRDISETDYNNGTVTKGNWISKASAGHYTESGVTWMDDDLHKKNIMAGIDKKVGNRTTGDIEWAQILEKNGDNLEAALKEQAEIAYDQQEQGEKMLDQAEDQTTIAYDTLQVLKAIAAKDEIDISGINNTSRTRTALRLGDAVAISNAVFEHAAKTPVKDSSSSGKSSPTVGLGKNERSVNPNYAETSPIDDLKMQKKILLEKGDIPGAMEIDNQIRNLRTQGGGTLMAENHVDASRTEYKFYGNGGTDESVAVDQDTNSNSNFA